MKTLTRLLYIVLAVWLLVGLVVLTPIGVQAQQTIRNITILAMPADATELPAAAALADNTSNPTVPGVAAFLMCFDSSTWDRCLVATDQTIGSAFGTSGPGVTASYKEFDGSALPTTANVGTEEEATPFAATIKGILYGFLTNEDGSKEAGALEDDAHATADYGFKLWSRRIDTAASSAGASGDYATLNTDGLGRTWVRQGDPCADFARLTTAAISTSSSGNVEIVALNGSDLVYVCGYSVVAGAATGVQLIYGTGTACATGETDLTGVWSLAANGGITQGNAGVPQFVVPAGNAFCIENSGANAVAGHVTYVRTAAP